MSITYPFKLIQINKDELYAAIEQAKDGEIIYLSPEKQLVIQKTTDLPPLYKEKKDTLSPTPKKTKLWAPKLGLTACVICHRDHKKHMGKGKCTRCYFIKPKKVSVGIFPIKKKRDTFEETEVDHSFRNQANAQNEDRELIANDSDRSRCSYSKCKSPRAMYLKKFMFEKNGKYYCCKADRDNDED